MEKWGGEGGSSFFFVCVFLPALSSSASLVETSHIQYPSSLLLSSPQAKANHRG